MFLQQQQQSILAVFVLVPGLGVIGLIGTSRHVPDHCLGRIQPRPRLHARLGPTGPAQYRSVVGLSSHQYRLSMTVGVLEALGVVCCCGIVCQQQ